MVNRFHLMGVEPINVEALHGRGKIIVKDQLGTVDRGDRRQRTVIHECLTKIRMCLESLDVLGKIHRVQKYPFNASSPYIISSYF
jgi:hypothetical protein